MRCCWIGLLAFLVECGTASIVPGASVDEVWSEARAATPSLPSDGSFEPEVCQAVLADLRAIRPPVGRNLDPLLSDAVARWLRTARSAFFECLRGDELEEAYHRLDRIEDELTALLGEG